MSECSENSGKDARFPLTRWTQVLHSKTESDKALQNLSELCEAYWPAVYAFARRYGCDPHTAQDLTPGFFAYVIEKNLSADAYPARG